MGLRCASFVGMYVERWWCVAELRVVGQRSSWDGEPTGYDLDGFYVEAMDKDKQAATLYARVPQHLLKEIENVIASGDLRSTPIKSKSDFIRDALVHNMHRIGRLVDSQLLKEASEGARRLAEVDALEWKHSEWRDMPERAKKVFSDAQRDGSIDMAQGIVRIFEPSIETIPEPYAAELEAVLRDVRSWLAKRRGK